MIGIVFATEMEAKPFLERGEVEGVVTVVSGMGLDDARLAVEKLIHDGCTSIINAGVCGALNDALERGSVHRVSMIISEELDRIDLKDDGLRLISVEKPVFESERRRRLSEQADLVDMEGYAVAQVCQEHHVPCTLIKGVTDFGDSDGKVDIQAHIDSVSEAVANKLCSLLECAGSTPLLKKLHSFTKVEHTIFSLPLIFAGAWLGAGGMPAIRKLVLIALVGLGARIFGMAINRILDRKIDAENPRTKNRELPSGTLSLGQGIAVAVAGIALYFVGCALLGDLVLKLSLVPLIPLALYSFLKRFTPLCHYGIGICLATAPAGAYVAVTNSLSVTPEIVLLALFSFCWMSGFDMIYALLDIDFDRAYGVRSIPAALGSKGAQWVAALTHLVAIVAICFLVDGVWSGLAAVVSVLAFIAAYLQSIPVPVRFFPISAIAGIAGALVVLLGR